MYSTESEFHRTLLGAGDLLEQLRRTDDESIRRAIVLSLGEYHQHGVTASDVEAITDALATIYGQATDPGLWAATEWSLTAHGQAASLTTRQGVDDGNQNLGIAQFLSDADENQCLNNEVHKAQAVHST